MACIRKRRGKYMIDFYDTQGIRRWKTLPKGITKDKAREAFRALEDQLLRGVYIPDNKALTFSEIAQEWVKHKRANLRESSWVAVDGVVRNHFHDLAGLRAIKITTATVEKWIAAKQAEKVNLSSLKNGWGSWGRSWPMLYGINT
jgi:hypothetical protein